MFPYNSFRAQLYMVYSANSWKPEMHGKWCMLQEENSNFSFFVMETAARVSNFTSCATRAFTKRCMKAKYMYVKYVLSKSNNFEVTMLQFNGIHLHHLSTYYKIRCKICAQSTFVFRQVLNKQVGKKV